jgi:hypothetical protein
MECNAEIDLTIIYRQEGKNHFWGLKTPRFSMYTLNHVKMAVYGMKTSLMCPAFALEINVLVHKGATG